MPEPPLNIFLEEVQPGDRTEKVDGRTNGEGPFLGTALQKRVIKWRQKISKPGKVGSRTRGLPLECHSVQKHCYKYKI